jgi:hypothetical protein
MLRVACIAGGAVEQGVCQGPVGDDSQRGQIGDVLFQFRLAYLVG